MKDNGFVYRALFLWGMMAPMVVGAAPPGQALRQPLIFEPNRGQADAQVQWIGRAAGYRLFLTREA